MDSEPKTLNEILDLIYDKVKKRKKDKEYRSGRISIPTRSELRSYLGKNYNSGFFDKYNNRQLPRKTTHSETRYWKG